MPSVTDRFLVDQCEVVDAAMAILRQRMAGEGVRVGNPINLLRHAAMQLHEERREVFLGYWVDANWKLLGMDTLAIGDDKRLTFSLQEIARKAIAAKAVYAYFLHNHPGERYASPSDKDRDMVEEIDQYLAMLGVLAVNHFVLGRENAYCIRSHKVFHFLEEGS